MSVFAILIGAGLAHADNSPKILRFGIMALAPYGFQDESGAWVGNFHDVAQSIIDEGGFEGSVDILPVARLTHSLLKKRSLDCTITAAVPFMDINYLKVASLGQVLKFGVLPLPQVNLNSYADLKKITIAVPIGAKMGLPFDEDQSLKKVEVIDYVGAMRMLEVERVDSAVGVLNSLMFSARKAGVERKEYGNPLVFKTLEINIYCQPLSPAKPYFEKIIQTVELLRREKKIDKIFERYR